MVTIPTDMIAVLDGDLPDVSIKNDCLNSHLVDNDSMSVTVVADRRSNKTASHSA